MNTVWELLHFCTPAYVFQGSREGQGDATSTKRIAHSITTKIMNWAVSTTNGPIPPVATEDDPMTASFREDDNTNEEDPPDDYFVDATVEDVSDDEDEVLEHAIACKTALEDKGNSKTMLFAMALGIINPDGTQFIKEIELNYAPYVGSSTRRSFVPKKKDLIEEVMRRATLEQSPRPKCKNWINAQLVDYLREHPITNLVDLVYVKGQVIAFEEALKAASAERASTNAVLHSQSLTRGGKWSLNMWMRLVHTLAEDEVKECYLDRHECDDREVLDARNSDIGPPTWDAAVVAKFNDKSWVPQSLAVPTLHEDFDSSFPLPFDESINPITSEQVKSRVADTKAKMVIVSILHDDLLFSSYLIFLMYYYFDSIQIVSNYEESGRGDGSVSREDGERDFGNFNTANLTFEADNRAAFLLGFKTHVLYFWHFCDTMDILASTLSLMIHTMTASSSFIPSATELSNSTKRKHAKAEKNEEEDRSLKRSIGQSFRVLTASSLQSNLSDTRKEYRQLKREWFHCNDPTEKEFLDIEINKVLRDIEHIELQLSENMSEGT